MPRPKGGKTRVAEEGAEHISTQDVEDAQLLQFKNLGGQYRIRTYILVLSMES